LDDPVSTADALSSLKIFSCDWNWKTRIDSAYAVAVDVIFAVEDSNKPIRLVIWTIEHIRSEAAFAAFEVSTNARLLAPLSHSSSADRGLLWALLGNSFSLHAALPS
jgi:hypothetical protein